MMIQALADLSSPSVTTLLDAAANDCILIGDPRIDVRPGGRMVDRILQVMSDTGAGLVYSDGHGHPRIDYQLGSIRDNFDFGPVVAIRTAAARSVWQGGAYRWGGFYDLRLRLSQKHPIVRIPEPLYSASVADSRPTGQKQFDYVDPRNRDYQVEMEKVATAHLQRIGALVRPERRKPLPTSPATPPVEASVVIPVRNRVRTVAEAVVSALGQKTDFSFNVIVVDNHSTDGTTGVLQDIRDPRLVHIIPERTDLGIGGCWNEAIYSAACGRYALQLDSDDLYSSENTVSRMVEVLAEGRYAMVIASYTMVNFELETIPPGLIDHREWTPDNGPNNALRINGLGAPRGFNASVARGIGFPNVSYGEDYAMALRISRDHEIGRVYDSVYLCRRWEGNTDSALPLETANRYDFYKDWIRSNEIRARQRG